MELNKIYQGDCLEIMPKIKVKSIDMVLGDPRKWFRKLRGGEREC